MVRRNFGSGRDGGGRRGRDVAAGDKAVAAAAAAAAAAAEGRSPAPEGGSGGQRRGDGDPGDGAGAAAPRGVTAGRRTHRRREDKAETGSRTSGRGGVGTRKSRDNNGVDRTASAERGLRHGGVSGGRGAHANLRDDAASGRPSRSGVARRTSNAILREEEKDAASPSRGLRHDGVSRRRGTHASPGGEGAASASAASASRGPGRGGASSRRSTRSGRRLRMLHRLLRRLTPEEVYQLTRGRHDRGGGGGGGVLGLPGDAGADPNSVQDLHQQAAPPPGKNRKSFHLGSVSHRMCHVGTN